MLNDEFSNLRDIAAGKVTSDKIHWKFPEHGHLMGTIVGFGQMENRSCGGTQHLIEVKLPDTGQIASAFLNEYLRQAMNMRSAQVGDRVLIQYLGHQPNERFHRYKVHVEKSADNLFQSLGNQSF